MTEHPFWFDEAWVAVGTRSPLAYIRAIAFSGPPGFALLLRIPTPGEQGMRLFPLVFSAAAVYAAYLFARDLGWGSFRDRTVVGALAALAVVVSPWSLLRIDLKHYTAEAFLALLLLWLAGRLEGTWERRRLVTLAALAAGFSVIGWTSMFVSVGVFVGLFVVACYRRESSHIRDLAVVGALVASVFGLVWWFLIRPFSSALGDHWMPAFLDGGVADIAGESWLRFSALMSYYPPFAAYVIIPIFAWGILVIARRKPATSIAVVVTGFLMVVLGRLELYPYLDRRTSHYFLVLFVAVVGAGLGSIAVGMMARTPPIGRLVAVGMAAILVLAGMPWFNNPSILPDGVRSQVTFVETRRAKGDVVLVSKQSRYGFGYYWQGGQLKFDNTVHFVPRVIGDGVIVYELGNVSGSLAHAIDLASQPGATGRIWVIRNTLLETPVKWDAAYAAAGITPESIEFEFGTLQIIETDG